MTNDVRIRILSVDDHPLFREGIGAFINCQSDMSLVGSASNGAEAMEAVRALRPDVTLMDLRLPDIGGIDAMIAIRQEFPDARVIVLTTFEHDAEIQRALKEGAQGYLLKSMPGKQMLQTIREVRAGRKCVLPEIAAGLGEPIGDEVLSRREAGILRPLQVHMKHIVSKLRAGGRAHPVATAARRGIVCW
jgi:DNA-binding NarL/FixJ family response regulator